MQHPIESRSDDTDIQTAIGKGHDEPTIEHLRAAYSRYCAALMAKNLAGVARELAEAFHEVTATGGVIARHEVMERLRLTFGEPGSIGPAAITIESFEPGDGRAYATVRRLMCRTGPDSHDPAATTETLVDVRVRDTWQLGAAGWRLERSRYLDPGIWGEVAPASVRIDSPRLADLDARLRTGDVGVVEAFWAEVPGTAPLVEPAPDDDDRRLVTFLWRGGSETEAVGLIGFPETPADKPLRRLGETDVWYRTELLPATARTTYGFQIRAGMGSVATKTYAAAAADPLNGRLLGAMSCLELPCAPAQPYIAERPGVARGTLRRGLLASVALGEDRPYVVHTPAGFDPTRETLGLLVVLDGQAYGGATVDEPPASLVPWPAITTPLVPTPFIVDNLIADGLIPRVVVLLVNNLDGKRVRDLAGHRPFLDFVAHELVPSVRAEHGLSRDPRRTVIAGSSLGGLAAAYAGLQFADVFGNVLSQSGSFWYEPDWELHEHASHEAREGVLMGAFAESVKLPLRFWMEVGRFEPSSIVLTNRHLRSVLELKGYPVTYSEFDGGHSYACWRGSLADGLIALLGDGGAW